MPLIIIVGFLTMPLTLIFKWKGFYILCISCYEWCSFSDAKRLFLENKDGQYNNIKGGKIPCSFSEDQSDIVNHSTGSSSDSNDLYNSPSYYFHPSNSHYSTTID
jgi:hypothetical protein